MNRICGTAAIAVIGVGIYSTVAVAQVAVPVAREPRRQFVTLSIDRMETLPLHFKEQPLEQLAGKALSETRNGVSDYHSADGLTTVDVLEFKRRNRGGGITVYPLGAGNGASLAVRASYEELPIIRFVIDRPSGREEYNLRNGRAYDLGAGVSVSDRSAGWGLGSHAFVLGGAGRVRGERGEGRRYFAEGGGGLNVGPFGVEIAIKFGYNMLDDPRAHNFFTLPFTLRGTVSF